MIEFLEDRIEQNASEAFPRTDGDVQFRTGDPTIDKWEQQLAAGEDPDFFEDVDPEERAKIERLVKRRSNQVAAPPKPDESSPEDPPEEFHDTYEDV